MAAGAWGGWGCCRGTASSAPHVCNVGWGWGRKTGKILVSLAVFAHSLERRGRRTRWGENMSALEPWWISQQTLHLWPGGKQTPVGRCQPWPRSLLQSFCPRWCFGMQQCLGAGSGAASFPSPPAQVVLNGDTSACPSPRTPLRATCDHCPGHIPPLHALQLPPPPTPEQQNIPSWKRTTWITKAQPIPPPWTMGDFSPVYPQQLPHVC